MRKKLLLLSLLLFVATCEKPPAPPEPLRPVKTMQVGMQPSDAALSLPGEVRARHEAPLGFRVGGKVTECKVNMGDTVRRGQVLARLEPADYQLAEQGSAANEAQAKSALTLAEADLKRYRVLREQNFVSAAALDQKQAAYDAARATLDAMQSSHSEQSRKVDYTALLADSDGVITTYDCNIGQVIAAGQPVLSLAHGGEKEIAIHLPEAELSRFRASANFTVSLNALPGKIWKGTLRELAAAADPATRTYAARIAVKDSDAAMQLGMSATVEVQAAGEQVMRLPLAAVVSRDSNPGVWVVDAGGGVHRKAITLGGIEDNSVRVASGLNIGDTVVTAGANLLREGEKVKLVP
jgi:membrane fusion protein, multidrug efflux system